MLNIYTISSVASQLGIKVTYAMQLANPESHTAKRNKDLARKVMVAYAEAMIPNTHPCQL